MDIEDSKENMMKSTAQVLVRMSEPMRRKLKIVAAMESSSLNEQIIKFITAGLSNSRTQFLVDELIEIEE